MKGNAGKPWYKKWWIWLIIVVVVGGIGNAIDGEEETAEPVVQDAAKPVVRTEPAADTNESADPVEEPVTEPDEEPAAEPTPVEAPAEEPVAEPKSAGEALDQQAVLDYTANMRGRTFLKEVQVGEHDISVEYQPDFEAYKAENPQSMITEEDYVEYFSTGDEIHKIMMEESARLLKEFPAANEIKISLPFEGKTYSVDLQEDAAETFFDVDFDTLKASDPTGGNAEWRAQVSDKYFNATDRQRFVDEFVTVQ